MARTNHTGPLTMTVLAAAVLALCLLALVATTGPAEAAFPGQNGKIFFDSGQTGNVDVVSINPEGTGESILVGNDNNNSERNPAVSPDGAYVAYEYARGIWVMNADGTAPRRLTDGTREDSDPAWSPEGASIVFSRRLGGDNEIYTMKADGKDQTNLTVTPNTQEYDPAWSPDGDRIAYQVSPVSGGTGIWVMDADGKNQTNLTPEARINCPSGGGYSHDEISLNPSWSPNGEKIVFAGAGGCGADGTGLNGRNIWTMDPDGSDKTRLLNDDRTNDTQPAFSPDGTQIVFASNRAENSDYDIYTMNASGDEIKQLTTSSVGAPRANPDWAVPPRDRDEDGVPDYKDACPDEAASTTNGCPPNEPPVAKNDSYKVKQGKPLSVSPPGVLSNDTDPDADSLGATLVPGPTKGKLTLNPNGSFVYKPKKGFYGRDSFVYEVSDGEGGTDRATVNIIVKKAARK